MRMNEPRMAEGDLDEVGGSHLVPGYATPARTRKRVSRGPVLIDSHGVIMGRARRGWLWGGRG
jgi:hypothetical protein